MTPIRYVHTLIETLPLHLQQRSIHSLQNRDEAEAEEILTELNGNRNLTNLLRYRFPHDSKQDQLIRAIFDAALKNAPERVLQAAGNSTYPLRKRVIWIDTPQTLSRIIGNTCVKLVISAAVIFASVSAGYIAYDGISYFATARALPFIINNTHLRIIDLFNKTMSLIETIVRYPPWKILCLACIGRVVILRGPPIPYLTAFARAINPLGIFLTIWGAPQTIATFLWLSSLDIARFGWNSCKEASLFLQGIAEKAEAERFACTKKHAYTLWVQSLRGVGLIGA